MTNPDSLDINNIQQAITNSLNFLRECQKNDDYSDFFSRFQDAGKYQDRKEIESYYVDDGYGTGSRVPAQIITTDRHITLDELPIHPEIISVILQLAENGTPTQLQTELTRAIQDFNPFSSKEVNELAKVHAEIKELGYTAEQVQNFSPKNKKDILATLPPFAAPENASDIKTALFALIHHDDAQTYLGVEVLSQTQVQNAHADLKGAINTVFQTPPSEKLLFMTKGFEAIAGVAKAMEGVDKKDSQAAIRAVTKTQTNLAYSAALNDSRIPVLQAP